MNPETDRYEHARANAVASLASIREMVARLEHAEECDGDPSECGFSSPCANHVEHFCATCDGSGLTWDAVSFDGLDFDEYHDAEKAREAIQEDALSVEVRSGWYSPGETPEAEEYQILLTTGGPALRIVGDLGEYGSIRSVRLEMQDWFIPWQELIGDSEDYEALRTYAGVFYFE